jgi:hypothetical protein
MSPRINHRHVLARLAVGPIYQNDSEYWVALKGSLEKVRLHFAEMGLLLVLDEGAGYAYLRQMSDEDSEGWSESGMAPLPRILRRTPLSYAQTVFLLLLRERLLRHEMTPGGDGPLYMDFAELTEMLRPYLPSAANNEKLLHQAVLALIRRFDALNLLLPMKNRTEAIYRVEPIIKAKLPPEKIAEVRARLESVQPGESESAETAGEWKEADDAN